MLPLQLLGSCLLPVCSKIKTAGSLTFRMVMYMDNIFSGKFNTERYKFREGLKLDLVTETGQQLVGYILRTHFLPQRKSGRYYS